MNKSYETRLRELAIQLVTPERFGASAFEGNVVLELPELQLFDDPDTIRD